MSPRVCPGCSREDGEHNFGPMCTVRDETGAPDMVALLGKDGLRSLARDRMDRGRVILREHLRGCENTEKKKPSWLQSLHWNESLVLAGILVEAPLEEMAAKILALQEEKADLVRLIRLSRGTDPVLKEQASRLLDDLLGDPRA